MVLRLENRRKYLTINGVLGGLDPYQPSEGEWHSREKYVRNFLKVI